MQTEAPRFLFVPVSGPGGAGEYYRSLAIARGFEQRWPGCRIRFVLNRSAPYAAAAPYPGLRIDDSPTRSTAAVVEYIASERPDVVIFDNAGRQAQFRAARAAGAAVVYVSSRPSTRRKGFGLRRMRALDQHWIVHPAFLSRVPNWYERCKLSVAGGPDLVFLEVMHEQIDGPGTQAMQQQLGIEPRRYVVFCPGGGGTFDPSVDPARVYLSGAQQVAAAKGVTVVAVLGPRLVGSLTDADQRPGLRILSSLPQGVLLGLIRDATVAAVNGGSLLLQSMAQRVPLLAAPIASDQLERIRQCARHGYVRPVRLGAAELAAGVNALLDDEVARATLSAQLERLGLRNGVDTAKEAVERLVRRAAEQKEVRA